MTEPPEDAVVEEAPAADPHRCWRCASPHDPFQEYCLECGARLAPLGGAWRRDAWMRESPVLFWATLLALLLIALITGAVVLAANDDGGTAGPTTGRTALGTSSVGPPTGTQPPAVLPTATTDAFETTTATVPTIPTTTSMPGFDTTTSAFPSTTNPATSTGTTTSGGSTIIAWPTDEEGYTVFLRSLPQSAGRGAAEAEARRAINAGLRQVGVLNSSLYSSLVKGYWVVFYGIHDTEAQAAATLPTAKNAGYPTAYIRHVQE